MHFVGILASLRSQSIAFVKSVTPQQARHCHSVQA
ncbi:hypothetical protein ALP86_05072 [Pseudomonas amygdali pv. mori]|uniref:Uncharacterized protein n=26 Tax=Pseudomonas syringae group TaxID=136849 RepID=A0A3M6GXE8_PSEAJ|nr:hypothetical protein Pgy4_05602 [Pseudomonas savastanoi pv. glycinea str. race 4]KPX00239.1 hypothetical protein ALO79_05606 [Pseudomonas syringae pv. castaneae]KPX02836.1 hypothetical protein ALO74_04484 [Pseudomonas syringae pv. cunninghamiae]KPX15513.1 hypothetical protein ALO71_04810 [Pseudomonas amygdali pv. dendropanacis]KPX18379.1 hypothetical protein ALO73_05179 [Pseudomonas syringae pv. daphniphylli]KPX21988.1 hypothetical protein ALO70_05452 [Pseudomonas amygdali pv. eriobotryae]